MNLNSRSQRAAKVKIYSVDTRKPRANAELAVFSIANGFEEMPVTKPLRKTPVFRYFTYKPNPTVGIPKATLEAAFKAAAAAALPPPPPQPVGAPILPPALPDSQGSYGAMHEDEGIDALADFFAEQGVASQGEFDELVALMESKAMIGGRRRKSYRRKSRKSRRSQRSRRNRH